MSDRVRSVESLYEAVVTDPGAWNDQMFIDWADSVASDGPMSRQEAKFVRRAMGVAKKLKVFWLANDARPDLGWESKVDIASGPKAWRPVLELAQIQLDEHPGEESFFVLTRLFRLVNNEEYLDAMGYDEWCEL